MTDDGVEARVHNVQRHYRVHQRRRIERLERLLIRSLYAFTNNMPYTQRELIVDIREELNRGPEDRLKSAPSRVGREGATAAAAFQRDYGFTTFNPCDNPSCGTGGPARTGNL